MRSSILKLFSLSAILIAQRCVALEATPSLDYLTRFGHRKAREENFVSAYPLFVRNGAKNKFIAIKSGYAVIRDADNGELTAAFDGDSDKVQAIRAHRWARSQFVSDHSGPKFKTGFLDHEQGHGVHGVVCLKPEAIEQMIDVPREELQKIADEYFPGSDAGDVEDRYAIVDMWVTKKKSPLKTGIPDFEESINSDGKQVYGVVILKNAAIEGKEYTDDDLGIDNGTKLFQRDSGEFPLIAHEDSKIDGTYGGRMKTTVEIYKNGKVHVESVLSSSTVIGFTGAVLVSILDKDGAVVADFKAGPKGVNGSSSTDLEFDGTVPNSAMGKAVDVEIRNIHDENPDRVKHFLDQVDHAAQQIGDIVNKVKQWF